MAANTIGGGDPPNRAGQLLTRLLLRRDLDPIERLPEIQHCPVLLVHGTRDEIVPFSHSQALLAAGQAANVPVSLRTIEGGDHNNLPVSEPPLAEELAGWLTLALRGVTPSATPPPAAVETVPRTAADQYAGWLSDRSRSGPVGVCRQPADNRLRLERSHARGDGVAAVGVARGGEATPWRKPLALAELPSSPCRYWGGPPGGVLLSVHVRTDGDPTATRRQRRRPGMAIGSSQGGSASHPARSATTGATTSASPSRCGESPWR